ncbi:MAG: Acyl dehydratase, partial [uncultured Sphingomonadaceae bacterium]
ADRQPCRHPRPHRRGDRRLALDHDRPADDRPLRRRDRRPAVHPRRSGPCSRDSLRRHRRARLPHPVAAQPNGVGRHARAARRVARRQLRLRTRPLHPACPLGQPSPRPLCPDRVRREEAGPAPVRPRRRHRDRRRGQARPHRRLDRPGLCL